MRAKHGGKKLWLHTAALKPIQKVCTYVIRYGQTANEPFFSKVTNVGATICNKSE